MAKLNEDTENFHFDDAPYSAQKLRQFQKLGNAAAFWDCWSLGLVILEVIVGTELVAPAHDLEQVEELLDLCGPHLDAAVGTLLKDLILFGDVVKVKEMLQEILPERPRLVTEAVRGFEQAVKEDGIF